MSLHQTICHYSLLFLFQKCHLSANIVHLFLFLSLLLLLLEFLPFKFIHATLVELKWFNFPQRVGLEDFRIGLHLIADGVLSWIADNRLSQRAVKRSM